MKRLYLSTRKLVTSIAVIISISNSLNASSGGDRAVEKARAVKVENQLKSVNFLTNLSVRYINETLDTTPTRGEIQTYFSKGVSIFRNYRNEDCTNTAGICDDNINGGIKLIFDNVTQKIEFQNIMGDVVTLSPLELSNYQEYVKYESIPELSTDNASLYFDFINFPSLENTLKVIDEANTNTSVTASLTAPTDITQHWYKPNGDGSFNLHLYNATDGVWVDKTKLSSLSKDTTIFLSEDGFNKSTTPGFIGEKSLVQSNNGWAEYVHDGTKWTILNSSSTIGDTSSTIDPLLNRGANQWYDADVDTEITVSSLFSNSAVTFLKSTDYWVSTSKVNVSSYNNMGTIIRNTYLTHDKTLLPAEEVGAVAYTTQNNGVGFEGDNQKYELYYDGTTWQNVIYTLDDLVTKANITFGRYWDIETQSFFENMGYAVDSTVNTYTYWQEDKGAAPDYIVISRGDRSELPIATDVDRKSYTYILGNEPTYTLDGLNTVYIKTDGTKIKYWYFTNSSNATRKLNNMTDHQGECVSISECSASGKEVALFQGNLIVLTSTGHFEATDSTLFPKCKTGFIAVPNTTPAMCVAKYEMTPYNPTGWAITYSAYGYNLPGADTRITSRAGSASINYVSSDDARNLCSAKLSDVLGVGISGGTSMRFATHKIILNDISTNPQNWSSGTVGNGYLYSGHNDTGPANVILTSSNDLDGYINTGQTTPSNQRRTHSFTNGEVIWDYSGNLWEVLYEAQNVGGNDEWTEYTNGLTNPFSPTAITGTAKTWTSANGVGMKVHEGTTNLTEANIGVGTYWLVSGGAWDNGSGAGLFASNWDAHLLSNQSGSVGFRCIYPAE